MQELQVRVQVLRSILLTRLEAEANRARRMSRHHHLGPTLRRPQRLVIPCSSLWVPVSHDAANPAEHHEGRFASIFLNVTFTRPFTRIRTFRLCHCVNPKALDTGVMNRQHGYTINKPAQTDENPNLVCSSLVPPTSTLTARSSTQRSNFARPASLESGILLALCPSWHRRPSSTSDSLP